MSREQDGRASMRRIAWWSRVFSTSLPLTLRAAPRAGSSFRSCAERSQAQRLEARLSFMALLLLGIRGMIRKILIIVHSERSTPGRIGLMLREKGFGLDIRRPCLG